jgi:hypothetical protein
MVDAPPNFPCGRNRPDQGDLSRSYQCVVFNVICKYILFEALEIHWLLAGKAHKASSKTCAGTTSSSRSIAPSPQARAPIHMRRFGLWREPRRFFASSPIVCFAANDIGNRARSPPVTTARVAGKENNPRKEPVGLNSDHHCDLRSRPGKALPESPATLRSWNAAPSRSQPGPVMPAFTGRGYGGLVVPRASGTLADLQ